MALQKHLLIVEDNEDITDVLTEIFTSNGYKVKAIKEAENIVQTVEELNPDVVITDYILSGINGGEYCSQIKKNPATAKIPVVILSGYAKVLESLGSYGADMVIYKPFDNDELFEKVDSLLTEAFE